MLRWTALMMMLHRKRCSSAKEIELGVAKYEINRSTAGIVTEQDTCGGIHVRS